MGAYLSSPVTTKNGHDGEGKLVRFGVSEMQGWRTNMEDAHIVKPDLADGFSLFAVFDGHGGKEVAQFCSKHMVTVLPAIMKTNQNDPKASLQKAFHKIDEMLRDEKYGIEIGQMAGKSEENGASGGSLKKLGVDNSAVKVRQSINSSLEDVKKKGKLTQKEAMEIMLKMMALQKMEGKDKAGAAAGGAGGAAAADEFQAATNAGCTANVTLFNGKQIICANAGDSRAVVCRNGMAIELSHDHKPNNPEERERIQSAGGWVTDGANGHFRVNGNLNLSRSIGDLKYKVDTKISPAKQIITAEPDIKIHSVTEEDEFFVIACDGVWDCMSNQEVCDFVKEGLKAKKQLSTICNEIFDRCIAEDPKQTAGIGGDNMSCIIVELKKR